MAIAVDSNNAGTNSATGTTLTWSHTCTGTNLVLVVSVMYQGNHTAVSIKYNGIAMTKSGAANYDGADCSSSIWYLMSPDTGAHNIVITKGSGKPVAAGSISFTGADTSAIGASNVANGSGAAATVTVSTTGTGNGFVVDCINGVNAFTITGGQTATGNYPDFGSDAYNDGAMSYLAYAAGANPVMSYSHSGNIWYVGGLEVKELASAQGNFLAFM